MLVRLWLLLACALVLAPPSARPAGATETAVRGAVVSRASHEQPTIEADQEPYSSDVRAAESAELLTVVARVLAVATRLPAGDARRSPAWRLHQATGWCDVVQCRRWAGTQLLRYATPPPARV